MKFITHFPSKITGTQQHAAIDAAISFADDSDPLHALTIKEDGHIVLDYESRNGLHCKDLGHIHEITANWLARKVLCGF